MRHQELKSGKAVWPGIAKCCRAVLWKILLSEKAEEAQNPRVFYRLSKYPDMRRTLHIIVAVDQNCIPLHQPL